ncbi:ABC transporter substrate-binding protein [Methylocapsa aurea]|uniref:ABC transporter substrate-binding protein n=1 Tax=Methylocapsa aurea TaxID=663610 RepID=UPI000A991BDC|nr:ABC transporter substrate-binding protein [Methylocapsa aurea]
MYPDSMAEDNPNSKRIKRNRAVIGSVGLLAALSLWALAVRSRGFSAPVALYLILAAFFNTQVLSQASPQVLPQARAADKLRVAAQKTGTFAWELGIVQARGLDRAAGLEIEVTELASPEAARIALMSGSVDMILSDWLWVARERSLGVRLVFAPYSSALGAVMIPAGSPLKEIADLKGKTLAVAGGPLDKSWLLLQALAQVSNLDLKAEANVVYGAPALLYQKAVNGEADANLNFWNFCIALEARGFRRLIGMDEVERRLGAKGPVSMVGYVFDESLAQKNPAALARFFKVAAQAKEALVHSDADWAKLAPRIGVADPAQLALYRQSYVEGVPRRSIEEEAADARALYRILAEIGGPELVGPAKELDPGVYYQAPSGR